MTSLGPKVFKSKSLSPRTNTTRPTRIVGASVVAKIRRSKTVAYGSASAWSIESALCISRAGHKCSACSSPSTKDNRLRAHHIISVSRGGRTVQANLKCVCERCHEKQPGHQHLKRR